MNSQIDLSEQLNKKLSDLKRIITCQKKVAIAFSAGVDSTLLLRVAIESLGENVLPITVKGAMMPQSELVEVISLACQMGVRPVVIETDIFNLQAFIKNEADRCYHCKKYIFDQIRKTAHKRGFNTILDGTNRDDQFDDRPGLKALSELNILSPLKEAGLTKKEIRLLSAYYGLTTAQKPSMACLATRIPTNTEITSLALSTIEAGEETLKALNLRQYRLRLRGDLVKIECAPEDFQIILNNRLKLLEDLKKLGLNSIFLDLAGYQPGPMNDQED